MVRQLDLLEERREAVTIRLADYQQKLAQRYNKDVKRRAFGAGDLVLCRAMGSARDINAGKLVPNWEGSYKVTAITGAKAYYLEDMEERPLPQPWNVQNLKKNIIIKYVKLRRSVCTVLSLKIVMSGQ